MVCLAILIPKEPTHSMHGFSLHLQHSKLLSQSHHICFSKYHLQFVFSWDVETTVLCSQYNYQRRRQVLYVGLI